MGIAIQIGASALIMLLFIGLAVAAKMFAWPFLVTAIVFIVMFAGTSAMMAYLTMLLRPRKEDDDEEN